MLGNDAPATSHSYDVVVIDLRVIVASVRQVGSAGWCTLQHLAALLVVRHDIPWRDPPVIPWGGSPVELGDICGVK